MENDIDEIEMCSNCFDEEEYDFGLCVSCVEEAYAEIEEMKEMYPLTFATLYGNVIHSTTTTKE